MMDDIERTLGRLEGTIEQGFKDIRDRMDRLHAGMYEKSGLEPRLRDVEGDVREIKTKAGMIATLVSVIVASAAALLKYLFNGR